MGQKVNPHGLRVGVIKDWDSRWYAEKEFADYLVEDHKLREFLKKRYEKAGVSKIEIERKAGGNIDLYIFTAKPGMLIGQKGVEIEALKKELAKMTKAQFTINIKEIKRPDKEAQLVAENIAQSLENRIAFRRAMKQAISRTMKTGVKGIKTMVAGRLAGADMARTESYSEGTIPLQTLRADIEYGFAEADTTYGKIGVKVWIYKEEVLPGKKARTEKEDRPDRKDFGRRDDKRNNDRRNDRRGGESRGRDNRNRDNKNFNRPSSGRTMPKRNNVKPETLTQETSQVTQETNTES